MPDPSSSGGGNRGTGKALAPIERRIGYKFRNSLLLAEALTHPSLAYETRKPHFDNQRLEFLGDAVLQLVLTEQLFRLFPHFAEGELTKLRALLVSKDALASNAEDLQLGSYLLLGRGEEANGGRARASTLADAFESLVGAIYLDGGLENARHFVIVSCSPMLERISEEPMDVNPKGELQEILQGIGHIGPTYEIIAEDGPDHAKTFQAEVYWEGTRLGIGQGGSKKQAETAAADDALTKQLWKARKNTPSP
ncbi:MAG: ribonuclease III [Verrucomicrobiota bacterium]